MQAVYGENRRAVSRGELPALLAAVESEALDLAIEKLRKADLLIASFLEGVVKQTGPGLRAFVSDTYLPLALGKDYIVLFSRTAIVHIIVTGTKKTETGGTGFFCADAERRLVTAAHNVRGREILRIEDQSGIVQCTQPIKIHSIIDGLDLAILDVIAPENMVCLKVERDMEEIVPLRPVYVAGFPQVPQQTRVPIMYNSAVFSGINQDYKNRSTYLISSGTSPGFSGGPALNDRGLVVGVVQGVPDAPSSAGVEEENDLGVIANHAEVKDTQIQDYDTNYSVLTPALYVEELVFPRPLAQ